MMETVTDTEHTPYALARLADCSSPDSPESAGAQWLARVASCLDEIEDEDDVSEQADSIVPIYTHEVWTVFVDLGAYNEDPTELGADAGDMEGCAKVCLFMIAERLLHVLLEEKEGADEEDEESED